MASPRSRRRAPASGGRALVVVSRFNEGVTRKLLDGATGELATSGFADGSVDVVWVPGAFELPVAVLQGLLTGRYAVAVALGAVIRGDTPHFEYVAGEATRGLGEAALRTGCPVGFGLLTCDTLDQAIARCGAEGSSEDKGWDAVLAALETALVLRDLRKA